MTIKPENLTNGVAGDANYPTGSFKDSTGPLTLDGTPLVKDWTNDLYGFFQRLALEANISVSDVADILKSEIKYEVEELEKRIVGKTEFQVYQFTAQEVGSCKIKLNYKRRWEKNVEPEQTFEITVTVVPEINAEKKNQS